MRRKNCWLVQGMLARRWYSLFLSHAHILTSFTMQRTCARAIQWSTANGGNLRLEGSQYPPTGNRKHEIRGDFLGVSPGEATSWTTVWNWKTGILLVNMVRALHNALSGEHT